MSDIPFNDASAMQTLISADFGSWSNPLHIDQELINQFAELSGDHMWMHVNEERCVADSPFGTTIAHGFLTLVLMSKMTGGESRISHISGYQNIMNYGSDKLRFTGAVPVDSKIHCRSRIKSVDVSAHKTTVTQEMHIHVVGQDERPVVVYELIVVFI
ncbi:MAG: acyl dehydratase [Halieaceae bacterium]|jgi:acyl dehydratase